MSNIETGGPAFPAQHFDMVDGEHGISIRDYFAAKAMQAYFAREDEGEWSMQEAAAESYRMADAMLEARK